MPGPSDHDASARPTPDTPPLHLAGGEAVPARPGLTVGPAAPASAKILTLPALLAKREEARRRGLTVVQCHGCFDIVHPGHLRHLRHAKAEGDVLLVTITGDSMISKGMGRPLIPQELRAENLAALDCVDWVYVEPRPTAVELLGEVRPDVYVKGREYELNRDPRFAAEKDAVLRHGGRIVFSSGDVVFSSSALIAALERSADPYHARLRALLRTPGLDGERLSGLVSGMRGKRVLVVGEPILDTYVLCDRPDVAGESPIMTLRPIERRFYDGGAAVIARHLAACGALPVLVTALDDAEPSRALRQRLLAEGVEVRALRTERPLPEKQRFLVGAQKVMKLDLVTRMEPDAAGQDRLLGAVEGALSDMGGDADAAVIADFGLGLLTPGVLDRLCPLLRPRVGVMSGDVSGKRSHLLRLTDMDLLCPSEGELREATRQFDEGLPAVAFRLLAEARARAAVVTMGPEGLIAFDRLPGFEQRAGEWGTKMTAEHVPALAGAAVDPLGCGDALLSAATLALAAGGTLLQAAFLGSVAAATQAQRLGNTVVGSSDLRHGVARLHASHLAYAPEAAAGRPLVAARGLDALGLDLVTGAAS
jgi:rfaE bifunctional protein nucleotidyltransferase chain/domain